MKELVQNPDVSLGSNSRPQQAPGNLHICHLLKHRWVQKAVIHMRAASILHASLEPVLVYLSL